MEPEADATGSACQPSTASVRLNTILAELREVAAGAREGVTVPEDGPFREIAELISRLIETRKRAVSRLELRNRMLTAVNSFLGSTHSNVRPDAFLEGVCCSLLENEHFCLVWVGNKEEGDVNITPVAAASKYAGKGEDCIKMVEQVAFKFDPSENPAALVIETRRPIVFPDIQKAAAPDAFKEQAKRAGFVSYASLPLVWKDALYGTLNIYADQPEALGADETDFLENLVSDVSLAMYSLSATRRLEKERDLNHEIVEAVDALLVSVRPCGAIRTFNSQAERITGLRREDVIGKYWVDVLCNEGERKEFQRVFSRLLQKDVPKPGDFRSTIVRKDGKERIINWHGTVLSDTTTGDVGLVFIGMDVTEHVLADRALDRARAEWERIFTAIQDPAMIVSPDGVILAANPATLASAKRPKEEVVGKGVCEVLHGGRPAGIECPLEGLISTRRGHILETQLRGLGGDYLLTVSPVLDPGGETERILLVARDLTEEKVRKAEALRAGQLAAIGELAAGVAHEINNPINGIINYSQYLLDTVDQGGETPEILERIIKEGERIATIVRNLLSFARQRDVMDEEINISEVIDECLSLVRHQILKDGTRLSVNIPHSLPMVRGNYQQIEQVFLNLLSNARYALNQRFPGADDKKVLEIRAEAVSRDGNTVVRIIVTDHGPGIPQDIVDRIIEPFFTTKPPGEGTGLGLSISHGIVRDHGGNMSFESVLGDHTSVSVELPALT